MLSALKSKTPQSVRNTLRPSARWLGRAGVQIRSGLGFQGGAPHFLVLGTQKGGTTTVYDSICRHPSVLPARTKEISYFDRYWDYGSNWYLANFSRSAGNEGRITGEATPDYLFSEEAPGRVRSMPGGPTRFIVLLRNPIDRALSHYFHERRLGTEKQSIEHAFALEKERLEFGDEPVGHPIERMTNRFCFGYAERGFYSEQLARWFSVFDPECFYIETSERFFSEPTAVVQEICDFLDLPPHQPPPMKPMNVGKYTEGVPAGLRASLKVTYENSISDLSRLLGRTFDWE